MIGPKASSTSGLELREPWLWNGTYYASLVVANRL